MPSSTRRRHPIKTRSWGRVTGTADANPGKRARRVFVYGYYGRGNFGDEAIRSILNQGFADRGVSAEFSIPAPKETADPPLSALRRWAQRMVVQWISPDVVVLGGGGLLKDSSVRGGLSLSVVLLPVWAQLILGKPLVIAGIGAGPFRDASIRPWVRLLCEVSSGVFVRDRTSAEVLEACGVDPSAVTLGADLFFTRAGRIDVMPAHTRELAVVALSVADLHWHCVETQADTHALVQRVADLVQDLAPGHRDVAIAQLSSGDANFGWQAVLVGQLAARGIQCNIRDFSTAEPEELIELMRQANVLIASRYHAVAAAALGGAPTVVLPFDPKCAQLAHQLGLDAAVVSPQQLVDPARRLRPGVQPLVPSRDTVHALTDQADAVLDSVCDLIANGRGLRRPRLSSRLRALQAVIWALGWGLQQKSGGRHD